MAQYVDAKAMYEAGYGSKYKPSFQEERSRLIDTALMQAGGWVINNYREAHKELKSVKRLGRKNANAIQIEMDRMGEQLSPQLDEALKTFKKEYDKGAKMASKGFGRKRREKGELMKDRAWSKMENLQKKLSNVETTMQSKIDSGLLEVGENATGAQQLSFNPGLTTEQFLNSARLASGAMLGHLSVDMETGDILYATQEDVDVSEEAYNEYVNEMGGSDGEGVLSYEDWQQLNENNPNIEYEQFERVDFGDADDTTFQDGYDGLLDKAEESGNNGRELDPTGEKRLQLKVNRNVDTASDAAIRSFLFGGDMVDGETLDMVTPAYKYLIQQGIDPGDASAVEGSDAHNNYVKFQSHLNELKNQDLSKGSPVRDWLKNEMLESSKAYHKYAYGKYEEKQNKKSRGKDSGKTPDVDDDSAMKKTGNYFINQQHIPVGTVNPTILALESDKDYKAISIPFNNDYDLHRRVDGQYQLHDGEKWVDVPDANQIALNLSIDSLGTFEGVSSPKELSPLKVKSNDKKEYGTGKFRGGKQSIRQNDLLVALQSYDANLKTAEDLKNLIGQTATDATLKKALMKHINKEAGTNIKSEYLSDMISDLIANVGKGKYDD